MELEVKADAGLAFTPKGAMAVANWGEPGDETAVCVFRICGPNWGEASGERAADATAATWLAPTIIIL